MKSAAHFTCLAAMVGATACSMGELTVRPIKSTLAEGRQPSNVRVAEGNAQLALNNVALAIEAYRKALREEPNNVEAMIGLASCYDRMGRADISRRHYEMALAVDPANTEVYSHFAQSLDAQGQRDEAARVKAELAARVVAPEASREVPGSVPVLPPPPGEPWFYPVSAFTVAALNLATLGVYRMVWRHQHRLWALRRAGLPTSPVGRAYGYDFLLPRELAEAAEQTGVRPLLPLFQRPTVANGCSTNAASD